MHESITEHLELILNGPILSVSLSINLKTLLVTKVEPLKFKPRRI